MKSMFFVLGLPAQNNLQRNGAIPIRVISQGELVVGDIVILQ